MREPDTPAAWQAWDAEQEAEDIRRRASHARTEDEFLEVLREAGGLGAGARVLNHGRPAQLSLTDRVVLAQCHLRESERLRQQAEAPVSDADRARYAERDGIIQARLEAFRVLGDGAALSEKWRLAMGAYGGIDHDYEAAIAAELAASALKETA